jgi:hypothetical protein
MLKLKQIFCKSVICLYDKYREDFYFVDRFHGSELHGGRRAAYCQANTNFFDESDCLKADDFRNEGKFLLTGGIENALPLRADIPGITEEALFII